MERIYDLAQIWDNIAQCKTRGVYLLNEKTRHTDFYSYAQLYQEAGKIGCALQSIGLGPKDRILISAQTSPFFLSLYMAIMWIGATPIPLPPREDLIQDGVFASRIGNILPHFNYYICGEYEYVEIKDIADSKNKNLTISTFSEIKKDVNRYDGDFPDHCPITLQDLAYVQFTSGSTRQPKGIMTTYHNLLTCIYDTWPRLEIIPEKNRGASWLPLYHDMGLNLFLDCLLTQTELVLIKPLQFARNPIKFLELISEFKVVFCSMPNFALEWIMRRDEYPDKNNLSLASLTWLGVGAEPVNVHTLNKFEEKYKPHGLRDGVLSPCYGLAEATLAVSIATIYSGYSQVSFEGRQFVTNGNILPKLEVKIKPTSNKSWYGNILIRGDAVAQKAIIDGNEERITDSEGFYDTKDIGFMHKHKLVILGRTDDMFVFHGENFFLHEIEELIKENIKEITNRVVAFHILADGQKQGDIKLVVLYGAKQKLTGKLEKLEKDIRELVLKNMGIPISTILAVVPRFIPLTSSGKLCRFVAREKFLKGFFAKYTLKAENPVT